METTRDIRSVKMPNTLERVTMAIIIIPLMVFAAVYFVMLRMKELRG